MNKSKITQIKHGDVWLCPISPKDDRPTSVQRKTRPCIIISNNHNNTFAPTVNIIPITSSRSKPRGTYQVQFFWKNSPDPQTVLCEQITTINKSELIRYLYSLDSEILREIKLAQKIQLNLD